MSGREMLLSVLNALETMPSDQFVELSRRVEQKYKDTPKSKELVPTPNKQSTAIAQIAEDMERTASVVTELNCLNLKRFLRDTARQLRAL